MTENKRYSFNWKNGHPNFWDNHCDLADCYLTCGDVVNILNELNDENEQLKEQLEICKDARQAYKQDWKACVSYCDTYKNEIHTLKDNIQGLIEENKMLKNNVEKLKNE